MRGTVLSGRYELVDKLGAGGMGEVWRARDRDLGREVAVKIFSPPEDVPPEEHDELLGRFRREARAAAALDSPHIATIHDHGAHDGIPYLVMELIEGRSLEQVLRDDGRVPVRQALDWATHITRALHLAHRAGVVHRDIKPANILVRPDHTAVVLDFGIAKFQEAVEAETRLTRTGHMPLGSVLYMAPERFRMEESDGREDLYALGCLLYELLIGRPPFTGPAAGVMYHHLNDVPLRPSRARPELPPTLDQLVLDLMAKDPDHRPANAQEAAERLDAVQEGAGARGVAVRERAEEAPEPGPRSGPVMGPGPEDAPPSKPAPAPAPSPAPSAPAAAPSTDVIHPPERPRRRAPVRAMLTTGAALLVLGGTVTLLAAREDPPGPDWTVVYVRPDGDQGADDAAVERIVRKGLKSSGLKGTLDVVASNRAGPDKVGKLPHVVAAIGATDLSPGVPGESPEAFSTDYGDPPVTVNACPEPSGYDAADPRRDRVFTLRASPTATADQLAAKLRNAPGVRSVLILGGVNDREFSERLQKSFSGDGRKSAERPMLGGVTDERQDALAAELKKAKADAVVLPGSRRFEGTFTASELREAGFRGRVVTPLHNPCANGAGIGARPEGGRVPGVEQYRYREVATDGGAARRNTLDAAHALASAFVRQRGTPDVKTLRGLLARNLEGSRVSGARGTLTFTEDGSLKSRPLHLDRFDGRRWREERKVSRR